MTTRLSTLLVAAFCSFQISTKAENAPTRPTQEELTRTALAAQTAALRALQAAHAAMTETSTEDQRRAMIAAESATAAAQAAAEKVLSMAVPLPPIKSDVSNAATAGVSDTVTSPVNSTDVPRPVTAVVKAGQANNVASITLTAPTVIDDGVNIFRAMTLSAPVGKGTESMKLATLDGLANSAAVQFSYTRRTLVDQNNLAGSLWSWKAAAKVGSEEFTYNEPANLAEATTTRTPYSASLAASINPINTSALYYVRYEYQRKYEASKNKVQCQSKESVDCAYGPAGAPLRKNTSITTLGARYLGVSYAVSPSLNYDIKSGVKGVDIPIYLFGQDKTSPLAGGIGAGWRSDTRDTVFYIFVGTPLDFWGM